MYGTDPPDLETIRSALEEEYSEVGVYDEHEAEMHAYADYLAEKRRRWERAYRKQPTWTTRDGTELLIAKMQSSHIGNCIRMLERLRARRMDRTLMYEQQVKLDVLREELDKRQNAKHGDAHE